MDQQHAVECQVWRAWRGCVRLVEEMLGVPRMMMHGPCTCMDVHWAVLRKHCARTSLPWVFSSWLKDQAALLVYRLLRIGTMCGKTHRVDGIYQLSPRCFPANNIQDVLDLRPR